MLYAWIIAGLYNVRVYIKLINGDNYKFKPKCNNLVFANKMAGVGRAVTDKYTKNDKASHTLFEGTGYLFEAGKLYNVCQVLPSFLP